MQAQKRYPAFSLGALLLTVCLYAASGSATVSITYLPPGNDIEKKLLGDIQQSQPIQSALRMIEARFSLQKKLDIIFGDGSKRGPFFQGDKISIPYLYVFHLRQYFNKRRHIHRQKNLDILIDAALIHALYHELGHALINYHQLPVAGLEEDTVDNLSNLLLIAHTPNGEELTRQAAMVFYLKSKLNKGIVQERYLWGEHRLSKQRYYTMLCQLYGSNPKKYKALIEEKGFSDERARKCVLEYRRMAQAWGQMLRPYWNPNG